MICSSENASSCQIFVSVGIELRFAVLLKIRGVVGLIWNQLI